MAALSVPRAAGALRRASWPWRIAALVAMLAAGALLAFTLAQWGWRWLGPANAPATASAMPETWSPAIVAAAPFGRAPTGAPAAPVAASLPNDAKLLGVFAGRGGEGYALLRLPDRGAVLVRKGQRIVGDAVLEAVNPNGIRIDERGDKKDIALRPNEPVMPSPARAAPAAAAPRPGATPVPVATAACARPAGFTGPVFRLNAELLSGMVQKPDSWASLMAPASGALVVRDESGLATMLGMKAGDRVAQANGIALAGIDDILTAVVRPLIASQPVRLSGTRDGKPREWLFLNAGACPPGSAPAAAASAEAQAARR